jgi:deazaflavin-dependent oxidoreductase (nitroreductase family)
MRKLPGILLTTTGRRSGEQRTVHLPYIPYGDDMVVVASFAGGPRNPAWFHNLKANPMVQVQYLRDRFQAESTQLEGAEATVVWEIVAVKGPWYLDYQANTERDIPLIKLHRLS